MNANREKVETLFTEALKFKPEERAAFLAGACGNDTELRGQLEKLLRAEAEAGGFLPEAPNARATVVVPISEGPGTVIGRYKLLQQVGEGGCGVVYMAEQEEPVRRRVALKVIKLGMDTRQVIARFEAERQALALMDHPNIAKVFDAGTTEAGRPFFVMELVRGIKITDHCDQNNFSTPERLDLFIKVCKAVQHAHQKGIIHRDIKPSNILVTVNDGVPVPKVIDFGIAKATSDQRLTDKTLFTAFEQFIGTPAYMSPEQAVMTSLDIDTRSDIYSLGVLLYELLTGMTPFDPKELFVAGLEEMRRTIREEEPVRPSTRLSTMREGELTAAAKHRQADPSKLSALLRGDLDWIVMKCLEKDRARRYETANGLSMDIQRHLNSEPIVARPPSNIYRLERMVRRNKLAFAASSAVAASLLFGFSASTWLWIKERVAHRAAVLAEAAAQAEKLTARQHAYGSDINLAQQALAASNLGQALELLNRQRPERGQKDLRGWEWRYLWQQCRSSALSSFTVTNWVGALAASPDGRWLAVAENAVGSISIWDLHNRQPIARLGEAGRSVVAFSPRSSVLAYGCMLDSGMNQYGVRLWDPQTRHQVAELPGSAECYGVAFSQDEKTLAASEWDGTVRLWQLPQGREASAPLPQGSFRLSVYGRPFAANGDLSLVARGGIKGGLCVFDLRAEKKLWRNDQQVWALAFSPDGKILASGARNVAGGPVTLWEPATGRELARLEGHRSFVSALVFGTNGNWLASASGDQTVRLWDVRDPIHVPPPRVLRGHKLEVWSLALLADGKTLASGSKDGEVCLWDTGPDPRERIEGNLVATNLENWCFSSDSRSIQAVDLERHELVEWQIYGGRERRTRLELGADLSSSCWSQDGRLLAVGSSNGLVQVWKIPAGKLFAQFSVAQKVPRPIRFDRQNGQLAVLAEQNLEIWDLVHSRKNLSWQVPDGTEVSSEGRLNTFGLAPDLKWAVTPESVTTSPGEEKISLRNLATGAKVDLGTMPVPYGGAISPDGSLVAVCSSKGFVRVWDTRTRQVMANLRAFLNVPSSIEFSPDGQRLAAGSVGEGLLRIWDADSWRELIALPGGAAWGKRVKFSIDGDALGAWTDSPEGLRFFRAPSLEEIEAAEKAEAKTPW
ncbi:MAG: serine/threonine-protein kinase [Verrucomicrobiota bacterium]